MSKVTTVLKTENIHGGYGKLEILHGIDIHVDKNEIVSIIGPNGSGKSTFIKVVFGLATYHSGRILYNRGGATKDGYTEINSYKANQLVKLGISYVPQRENVFPSLTVEDNLKMGGYSLTQEKLVETMDNIYQTYPILDERRQQKAKTLSGGQRQLLALSRALMIDPELILMDEPSAALQPSLVTDIMDQIVTLREKFNKTILLVEQNTRSALNISDRGYIFAAGRCVHTDTGYELLHNTNLGDYYLGKVGKKS